jgi:putative toxin-antitoxin system antitoxin component (TIGR02293 family)
MFFMGTTSSKIIQGAKSSRLKRVEDVAPGATVRENVVHLAPSRSVENGTDSASAAQPVPAQPDEAPQFRHYKIPFDHLAIANQQKNNPVALIAICKKGINANRFFELAESTGLRKEWLAINLLGLSLKTLQRYQAESKPLTPKESEAILMLETLYEKGAEIFGNKVEFNKWMNEPAFGLGEQIPFELIGMSTGIKLIMDELLRIEFGATA